MNIELIEKIAEAIHNNWQATGKGYAHRTWQETKDKLPGQADSFRLYAKVAIVAYENFLNEH